MLWVLVSHITANEGVDKMRSSTGLMSIQSQLAIFSSVKRQMNGCWRIMRLGTAAEIY